MWTTIGACCISLFLFAGFLIGALLNMGQQFDANQKLLAKIPKEQSIATTCYVDEKIHKMALPQGYFYIDKQKYTGTIIDQRKDEVEVRFSKVAMFGIYEYEQWLPKKDFYPYYSL